ncbi:MAG TPA: MFS transporter, partial [Cryomorphaceae bacterium]|nr:MFS transporter [Cryomorphaceae bacterium]
FPFLLIVGVSLVVGVFIVLFLKPIDEHLKLQTRQNPFRHMLKTLGNKRYLRGFSATVFLATGGFMLMPFGAAFAVNNLGISMDKLPLIYMFPGITSMILGPIAGKLSDSFGKFRIFMIASLIAGAAILVYCNLGTTPLWIVIALNIILFVGITGRIVSSQALITAVPEAKDRGSFMSVNSAVMQISGGIASAIAGMIVFQDPSGFIHNYPMLGYVVGVTVLITIGLMFMINRMVFSNQTDNVADKTEKTDPQKVMLKEA